MVKIAIVDTRLNPKKVSAPPPPPPPIPDKVNPAGDYIGMCIGWGCLAVFLMFYGIGYFWASSPQSMLHRYSLIQMSQVVHDFQAKIDEPDILSRLTNCLQEELIGRNATVVDFDACLQRLGMAMGE
jgi:hypothetical protein